MQVNQTEKNEYAIMIQDLRDEMDKQELQLRRYEKQEQDHTSYKEQQEARVQRLECDKIVLEQNMQLKVNEFNELADRYENLRLTNSASESAHDR